MLKELNPRLYPYNHVRKVVVAKDSWMVSNNLITPTMKIKRNIVKVHYVSQMEPWFEREEIVVWEK